MLTTAKLNQAKVGLNRSGFCVIDSFLSEQEVSTLKKVVKRVHCS